MDVSRRVRYIDPGRMKRPPQQREEHDRSDPAPARHRAACAGGDRLLLEKALGRVPRVSEAYLNPADEELTGRGIFQHEWGESPDPSFAGSVFSLHLDDGSSLVVYHGSRPGSLHMLSLRGADENPSMRYSAASRPVKLNAKPTKITACTDSNCARASTAKIAAAPPWP